MTWQEKIKSDYKSILPNEQIEATTKYWQEVVDQERKAERIEIINKLLTAFDLTIKDLPAFPKKGTDLINLILAIGIDKAKKQAVINAFPCNVSLWKQVGESRGYFDFFKKKK